MLPAKAQPQVDSLVRPSSANTYSFRLSAMAGEEDVEETDGRALVAYSAKSLALAAPSALHCALCNAPLVDSSSVKPTDYSGLPSEHWEELIGSWLCHDEMKLDLGSEGAGGVFWPQQTEILVGGTYLMLKETLMLGQSWRIRAGGEVRPSLRSCLSFPFPGPKEDRHRISWVASHLAPCLALASHASVSAGTLAGSSRLQSLRRRVGVRRQVVRRGALSLTRERARCG